MNHTQLLNYLIDKHSLKSYLEIGVRSTEQNFDKVRCGYKIGVDPCFNELLGGIRNEYFFRLEPFTSDEFFNYNKETFDCIFLDGLHHADQVERDFNNSLACLNDRGFIVIHDCLPTEEITTCVPRWNQKIWHGDVYKFCMKLNTYYGIGFVTLNMDEGCCIVWKELGKKANDYEREPISWDTYKEIGRVLLNVVEPERFFKNLVT